MSGPRTGISATGADAAEIVELAVLAEAHNVDLLVVGNVRAGRPNGDDTYVVTAAAAAAARTRYPRIAVVLDLRGSAPPLRVAEDLGVLDVLSHGRLELLVRQGPDPDPSLTRDLDSVLGAWTAWPLDDAARPERFLPVTPSPVQPEIPTWLVDAADPATGRSSSRVGSLVFLEWPAGTPVPDAAELHRIRKIRGAAEATTVVFDLADVPRSDRTDAVKLLGTVVAPCLRCADEEVDILALDSADWLLRRTALHEPPKRNDSPASFVSPSTSHQKETST
ncbi:hypothetical protein GCM10009547_28400 [Sporichthya brevicatena]|uniref:STAS domain-containing protein n=1 Tax=Sporichthya brevicatena TaxID=171442 RepID=A0ABN1GYH7_9ACTN